MLVTSTETELCRGERRIDGQGVDVQGFFLVPYRIFAPTLFPILTVLRYCRILPYPM